MTRKCAKIPFDSSHEALKEIRRIRATNKFHGDKRSGVKKDSKRLRTYLCWTCQKWHTTTQKKMKWESKPKPPHYND